MRTRLVTKFSFKDYLKIGLSRNAFAHGGDLGEAAFAQSVIADGSFSDFTEWENLGTFLITRHARPETITIARRLFNRWKAGQ